MIANRIIPDFFIVGAPKCGTTSLSAYLASHPEIVISDPKEPHFFSKDLNNGGIRNLDRYFACFKQDGRRAKAVGEASTLYLYSNVAIPEIIKFNENAKFVVMLRSPLEIAYTFHQVALKNFGESELDFEKAWSLQEKRLKGLNIPAGCPDPKLLAYGNVALLGEQVGRLLAQVEPENIQFVYFQDFITRTADVYGQLLRFLNVDETYQPDFVIHNPSVKIKFPTVTKWVNKAVGLKKRMGVKKQFGIANQIHELNESDIPLEKINSKTHKRMSIYFKKDVNKLSSLLKKDLSDWLSQ